MVQVFSIGMTKRQPRIGTFSVFLIALILAFERLDMATSGVRLAEPNLVFPWNGPSPWLLHHYSGLGADQTFHTVCRSIECRRAVP